MSKIAAALKSAPDDITVFKSANSTHMQKFLVPIKRASTVRHQLREFSEKMKEYKVFALGIFSAISVSAAQSNAIKNTLVRAGSIIIPSKTFIKAAQ